MCNTVAQFKLCWLFDIHKVCITYGFLSIIHPSISMSLFHPCVHNFDTSDFGCLIQLFLMEKWALEKFKHFFLGMWLLPFHSYYEAIGRLNQSIPLWNKKKKASWKARTLKFPFSLVSFSFHPIDNRTAWFRFIHNGRPKVHSIHFIIWKSAKKHKNRAKVRSRAWSYQFRFSFGVKEKK